MKKTKTFQYTPRQELDVLAHDHPEIDFQAIEENVADRGIREAAHMEDDHPWFVAVLSEAKYQLVNGK